MFRARFAKRRADLVRHKCGNGQAPNAGPLQIQTTRKKYGFVLSLALAGPD